MEKSILFYYINKTANKRNHYGWAIGTIGNYLAGNSSSEGFREGAFLGIYIDFQQYMIRGLYLYLKEQFKNNL